MNFSQNMYTSWINSQCVVTFWRFQHAGSDQALGFYNLVEGIISIPKKIGHTDRQTHKQTDRRNALPRLVSPPVEYLPFSGTDGTRYPDPLALQWSNSPSRERNALPRPVSPPVEFLPFSGTDGTRYPDPLALQWSTSPSREQTDLSCVSPRRFSPKGDT